VELTVWPEGKIHSEQFFWCQGKWWACSWLSRSPVSQSPFSVSLNFSIQMPVYGSWFLPETLVWKQNLCSAFSETVTKFYVHWPFLCQIHCETASGLICDSNKRMLKIIMSTELSEVLHTDFHDMLEQLPSTALCYYNCSTDWSTDSGNYG
jgi:hypothetical protein